jgi:hypothetical protein
MLVYLLIASYIFQAGLLRGRRRLSELSKRAQPFGAVGKHRGCDFGQVSTSMAFGWNRVLAKNISRSRVYLTPVGVRWAKINSDCIVFVSLQIHTLILSYLTFGGRTCSSKSSLEEKPSYIRNPESLPSTCRLGKLQRRANIHRYAIFISIRLLLERCIM